MGEEFKKRLARYASKQILEMLIKKAAFLSWGPLSWIISEVLYKLAYKFLEATILGLHIIMLEYDVKKDVDKVEKILEKIKSVGEGTTSAEKEKLDKELAEAGIDLIKFNIK